jgi:VIT1/CCC1 family predicted Fe2+/Mn2+ transporter
LLLWRARSYFLKAQCSNDILFSRIGELVHIALLPRLATQLMQHDALGAHGSDELGISDSLAAQPVQAAMASAGTFAVGAALPFLMVLLLPASVLMWGLAGSSLIFLAQLGLMAARAGGAPVIASVTRVVFWGLWQWH